MKVTIISTQAIIAERDDCVWTGQVDTGQRDKSWAQDINGFLFRYFNRVDDDDHDKLEAIGYRLPSLSVGDVLYWDCKAYRVAGIGFEHLTSDALVMANVFGALKDVPSDD